MRGGPVPRAEDNEGVVYTDAQQQEGGGKVQRDELDPNVTAKSKAGNLKDKKHFPIQHIDMVFFGFEHSELRQNWTSNLNQFCC